LIRLAKHAARPASAAFVFACFSLSVWSQSSPVAAPTAPIPSTATKPVLSASNNASPTAIEWSTLSPQQQVALRPLSSTWKTLSDQQKRKWLSLSANFPRLSADEQAKLQSRMAQWAALSPRQREQARLNYAEVKKISPQQKSEQWEAYQALNPQEKQKLATSAQPKPPRTALAVKTEPPNKINRVPVIESDGRVRLPVPIMGSTSQTLLGMPPQKSKPASSPAHASSAN
jgi:hypothetical protein